MWVIWGECVQRRGTLSKYGRLRFLNRRHVLLLIILHIIYWENFTLGLYFRSKQAAVKIAKAWIPVVAFVCPITTIHNFKPVPTSTPSDGGPVLWQLHVSTTLQRTFLSERNNRALVVTPLQSVQRVWSWSLFSPVAQAQNFGVWCLVKDSF